MLLFPINEVVIDTVSKSVNFTVTSVARIIIFIQALAFATILRELPSVFQDMADVDYILGVSTNTLLFEVQSYEWTETLV